MVIEKSRSSIGFVYLFQIVLSYVDSNEKLVEKLIEKGADVNVTDLRMRTALHISATHGTVSMHYTDKIETIE